MVGGKSALRVGEEGGEALLFFETQPISFHFGFMIGLVISGSTRHDFEEKTESTLHQKRTRALRDKMGSHSPVAIFLLCVKFHYFIPFIMFL